MTVQGVDDQLTILLEIQDLNAKVREFQGESGFGELQEAHFNIDPAEATETLKTKVAQLEDELDPRVRRRYDRIAGRVERVLVPVINGTCYGCFVDVPTATAGDTDRNASLRTCEHCGRFLYFLA